MWPTSASSQLQDQSLSGFHLEKKYTYLRRCPKQPGPRNQVATKFPCKQCVKAVRNNQDAILCEDCGTWAHRKWLGMSQSVFKYYFDQPLIAWTCYYCALPKFELFLLLVLGGTGRLWRRGIAQFISSHRSCG